MNTSHSSAELPLRGREKSWALHLPCDLKERTSVTPIELRGVNRTTAAHHENQLLRRGETSRLSTSWTERSQSVGPQPSAQRWRLRVNRPAAGESSTTELIRATHTLSRSQSMLQHSIRSLQAQQSAAWPNTSLKRSANGMARWPSSAGPAAHFALAVQHAMPLATA